MGRLASIKPTETLSDRAYAILKEAIVTNELKPGELLVEGKLAEQMDISRTPIRAALKRLTLERLVMVTGKSMEVAGISFEEMQDIVQMRMMVEPQLFTRIPERFTDKQLESVKQIQHQLEHHIGNRLYRNYVDYDIQFHMFFINLLENRYLCDYFRTLLTNYGRIAILSGTCKQYGEAASSEHDRLIDALEQKDFEQAENMMYRHLRGIYERYCGYWNREPQTFL